MKFEATTDHTHKTIRVERTQGMNFGRHLHNSFEFFFVVSGEVFCTVENFEHRIGKGQGLLILPNQPHSYRTPRECSTRSLMIIFDPLYVNEFFQDIKEKKFIDPVFVPPLDAVNHLPPTEERLAWKAVLYRLCAEASRQCRTKKRDDSHPELVEKIIDFIQNNLTEPITLHQLAEHLGYNYHYLSSCIKSTFGVNFCSLLHQIRIDHAVTLLKTTKLSITRVAEQSGFSSIRSFNRVFYQILSCTPSEYLRKNPAQNK